MGLVGVRHFDNFEREDAVAAGGVGVQLGGGKLQVLPPDHERLVGLVSAQHLHVEYPEVRRGMAL